MTYDRLEELSEMFDAFYDEFMMELVQEDCGEYRESLALLVDFANKSHNICVNLANLKYVFNNCDDEMVDMEEVHSHVDGVVTKVEPKLVLVINGNHLYRIEVDALTTKLKVGDMLTEGTLVGYKFLD